MELKTLLNTLFPFYIKIHNDETIIEVGSSTLKIYPEIIKSHFLEYFNVLRPRFLADNIFSVELQKQLILLKFTDNNLIFRGQFIKIENDLYFFGSPWVTNSEKLLEFGLYGQDFAIHDQLNDLLLAIQEQKIQTTEIRELAKNLEKQKLKAEEFTRSKDFFLANMSHEIRTPMNAIIGFSELLSDTELNSEQEKYIKIIEKSSKNLLVIVNDILDLSKIQANKLEIKLEPINLVSLIDQVNVFFKPTALEKKINLVIKHEISELNNSVIADEVRLTQVLSNLISNALKFTTEGVIELVIKVTKPDKGRLSINFSVIDTGIGIPEKKLKNIFDDFYQLDIQLNKKFKGTGLGLSICKNLVTLMGGELMVESEVGKGTTFYFNLEFDLTDHTSKNDHQTKANNYNQGLEGMTILVAEDNEFNQELLRILLEKNGINVVIVENGEKAIIATQKNVFDVILMDIQMPVMDGITAMKEIKKQIINTPIIALTANAINGQKEKMLKEGFDEYLSKPFKISDLTSLLRNSIK